MDNGCSKWSFQDFKFVSVKDFNCFRELRFWVTISGVGIIVSEWVLRRVVL